MPTTLRNNLERCEWARELDSTYKLEGQTAAQMKVETCLANRQKTLSNFSEIQWLEPMNAGFGVCNVPVVHHWCIGAAALTHLCCTLRIRAASVTHHCGMGDASVPHC
ncbi:hypothetical protein C8R43DRAFT_952778 [Mycena crocata]|nr:hypothetical protein C8R43DRAFT_952778 [Mycena crocata]